jgi:hypothetical protein
MWIEYLDFAVHCKPQQFKNDILLLSEHCVLLWPLNGQDIVPSGAKCTQSGIYLSHGCGHAERKVFEAGEVAPHCSICNWEVNWILKFQPDSDTPPKSFLS